MKKKEKPRIHKKVSAEKITFFSFNSKQTQKNESCIDSV